MATKKNTTETSSKNYVLQVSGAGDVPEQSGTLEEMTKAFKKAVVEAASRAVTYDLEGSAHVMLLEVSRDKAGKKVYNEVKTFTMSIE